MTAPAAIDTREVLRRLLIRGALAEKVDLGSWISIDGYLIGAGVVADDLNALTEEDLDEVRRRLQRRGSLLERLEGGLEAIDESRFGPAAMAAAIGIGILVLLRLAQGAAHAAARNDGPEPSNVAGLLISLVPFVVVVLLLAAATRGEQRPADEEAFGDTTGFGEQER